MHRGTLVLGSLTSCSHRVQVRSFLIIVLPACDRVCARALLRLCVYIFFFFFWIFVNYEEANLRILFQYDVSY